MKIIDRKTIIAFILGALIFGSTGVIAATLLANNVSYDNTNSGINSTNVQGAIDELYTKANTTYDEYSGTTTYTPTTSTQTVPTNNKLMKSDITINAIPSSYKNLSTTTTATASDIVSGKTAYNNSGTLLTGTYVAPSMKGTEWNYNSFVSTVGENTINVGFQPNRIVFLNNSNGVSIIYDKTKSESTFMVSYSSDKKVSEVSISSSLTSTGIRSIGSTTKIYLVTAGNTWSWFATK